MAQPIDAVIYKPQACLSWGMCAKVEISDQYTLTAIPSITATPISHV
jgi:hypothetical protein